mmetsp:Transcript_29692/g.42119  ORF Transcript_29692/g.42119 Transcript_29692/m.42119 type:complete len:207 (+) Transcript_29692:399-1019(+)
MNQAAVLFLIQSMPVLLSLILSNAGSTIVNTVINALLNSQDSTPQPTALLLPKWKIQRNAPLLIPTYYVIFSSTLSLVEIASIPTLVLLELQVLSLKRTVQKMTKSLGRFVPPQVQKLFVLKYSVLSLAVTVSIPIVARLKRQVLLLRLTVTMMLIRNPPQDAHYLTKELYALGYIPPISAEIANTRTRASQMQQVSIPTPIVSPI